MRIPSTTRTLTWIGTVAAIWASILISLTSGPNGPGQVIGSALQHERLQMENHFKSPEEVIRYYVARDASGFVWSGLLDSERRAFTLWKEVPNHESFYIAKRYEIIPSPISRQRQDEATVEVRYVLIGIGDSHGTLVPAENPERNVRFNLKRVNGQWKIAQPMPPDVPPVVLESKFPFVASK